ncbi:hypothetical protein [Paraburkholderia aromaticivorans]|uniref:Uncharacterized protein n=1 Tax=Paraburkholderia aromaticivorans TaxID=2026199 RepID=A0A248VXS9_9BURK|nr:hypothetical protein [Paraburkholderia aromaticivorans]ASW03831.1 hypothetical protein CJU94_37255 [Paraburkholderia aromaticivorans]
MGIEQGEGAADVLREVFEVSDVRTLDAFREYQSDWQCFVDPKRMTVVRVPRETMAKILMGGNTFQMFQSFGGLDLCWLEVGMYGMECCRPFSRSECEQLIKTMRAWLTSDQAEREMRAVGTDRRYVQGKLDQLAKLLAPDPEQAPDHFFNTWLFLTVERFLDDDRGLNEMCELADDYADRYWGECADH